MSERDESYGSPNSGQVLEMDAGVWRDLHGKSFNDLSRLEADLLLDQALQQQHDHHLRSYCHQRYPRQ